MGHLHGRGILIAVAGDHLHAQMVRREQLVLEALAGLAER
jgi:hypothetical protein